MFEQLDEMKKNYPVHVMTNSKGKTIHLHESTTMAPKEFFDWKNQELQKEIDGGFVIHTAGTDSRSPNQEKELLLTYRMANALGLHFQRSIPVPHLKKGMSRDDFNTLDKMKLAYMVWVLKKAVNFMERNPQGEIQMKAREKLFENLVANAPSSGSPIAPNMDSLIEARVKLAAVEAHNEVGDVVILTSNSFSNKIISHLQVLGYEKVESPFEAI